MSPHELFAIANPVAAAAWVVLILAPLRLEWPGRLGVAVALLMAMTYSALIGAYITQGQGDFSSLAGVARLFEHPGLLLAGWVHYLAFDLLVGVWQRTEAARCSATCWSSTGMPSTGSRDPCARWNRMVRTTTYTVVSARMPRMIAPTRLISSVSHFFAPFFGPVRSASNAGFFGNNTDAVPKT